jgi:hypothetical protein
MSKSVKIDESIREWDGYALFDKDNVLASDLFCESIVEADSIRSNLRDSDSVSIWNVTLTRVSRAEATHKPVNKSRIKRKLTPVLLELTAEDIFEAATKEA